MELISFFIVWMVILNVYRKYSRQKMEGKGSEKSFHEVDQNQSLNRSYPYHVQNQQENSNQPTITSQSRNNSRSRQTSQKENLLQDFKRIISEIETVLEDGESQPKKSQVELKAELQRKHGDPSEAKARRKKRNANKQKHDTSRSETEGQDYAREGIGQKDIRDPELQISTKSVFDSSLEDEIDIAAIEHRYDGHDIEDTDWMELPKQIMASNVNASKANSNINTIFDDTQMRRAIVLKEILDSPKGL